MRDAVAHVWTRIEWNSFLTFSHLTNVTEQKPDAETEPNQRKMALPIRAWQRVPDWAFRVLGAVFFFMFAWTLMRNYGDFPNIGPYWVPPDAGNDVTKREYFPAAKILTDLTFVLIALSFSFRIPPIKRAAQAREIFLPLLVGFWPLAPFVFLSILLGVSSEWAEPLRKSLSYGEIGQWRFFIGVILVAGGNALDVWGYSVLFRSFSIVAEARALKVTGPYRFVRHPVYFGQLVAQGGIWLILFELQLIWVLFYIAFVVLQLWRSKIEDQVLERAFGDSYLEWKKKTFWFI